MLPRAEVMRPLAVPFVFSVVMRCDMLHHITLVGTARCCNVLLHDVIDEGGPSESDGSQRDVAPNDML